MWRSTHSFLELLRQRLPDSLQHLRFFLYMAYSMVALFRNPVPRLAILDFLSVVPPSPFSFGQVALVGFAQKLLASRVV